MAMPSTNYKITTLIDFNQPGIGHTACRLKKYAGF